MSVEDETWDRPTCEHCLKIIRYGEHSSHIGGKCILNDKIVNSLENDAKISTESNMMDDADLVSKWKRILEYKSKEVCELQPFEYLRVAKMCEKIESEFLTSSKICKYLIPEVRKCAGYFYYERGWWDDETNQPIEVVKTLNPNQDESKFIAISINDWVGDIDGISKPKIYKFDE